MKSILFVLITIGIAWCRFTLPPGSPDLLAVWLVTLAFYTESKFAVLQAFWIGILHDFPGLNPWVPMVSILVYKFLQHQRFHLGRDHFLPRFFTVALLTALFDFIEWAQLSPLYRSNLNDSLQLMGTHAALTAVVGLLLLSFGQKMETLLGFRQTRYDF